MVFQKVAVPVMAGFCPDGTIKPQYFVWNKEKYMIDEARELTCISEKEDGALLPMIVYECVVKQRIVHLYLIKGIWYVNVKGEGERHENN